MPRERLFALTASVFGICLCATGSGADFQIHALPAAAFDPINFAPIPLTLDSGGSLVGNRPMIVQVDIDVLSTGYSLAADQRGFGAMTFNLDLFGSFHNTSRPGWLAQNPLVDIGLGDQASRWMMNADAGKPGDLQSILISNPVITAPNPLDVRPGLTVGTALKIGSIFIDWDGNGAGGIRIVPGEAAFAKSSNGQLTMFAPSEMTMMGGMFHTPGWIAPNPPVAWTTPPSPVTTPPTPAPPVTIPPANAPPVAAPPATLSPDASPEITPVSAPTADSPVAKPSPTAKPVDPPTNPSPPVISPPLGRPDLSTDPTADAAITIMPWHGRVGEITSIDLAIATDLENSNSSNLTQLAFFTDAILAEGSALRFAAANSTDGVPEPSGICLALAAAAAWIALHRAIRQRSKPKLNAD